MDPFGNGALARVHSISKAVPLLRVAVVCLSRKLGLLIVHRQLRWFKGWIRDKGYVRSSDSKSIQDDLSAPRSWLWDCNESVTQVELHKVILRTASVEDGRLRRMYLNFGAYCFFLLESTWQTCSDLSCLLVVSNKGVDGLLRSNGLRDLNDTHSLCTGRRWFLCSS